MATGNDATGGAAALELIGQSRKMKEVGAVIDRVADTDIPILICGESGTGKGLVAEVIHARSLRRHRPFLKVNCASIPTELLESELFGYERGSFTGAFKSKPGKFEMAQEGTVFLDQISEMGLSIQPKLLQVLQDGQFCRLGARQEITVDIRFIASTQASLESLVGQGKFRADLYYRLNVITVQLPPLRERKEDIPQLAEALLAKHAGAAKATQLSDRLLRAFMQHDWPGNIRELENTIRRVLTLGEEAVLQKMPARTTREVEEARETEENELAIVSLKEVARQAAWQAEREMILRALKKTNWNRRRAAELLNISYKAMLYKLKDAGLAKHSSALYSS